MPKRSRIEPLKKSILLWAEGSSRSWFTSQDLYGKFCVDRENSEEMVYEMAEVNVAVTELIDETKLKDRDGRFKLSQYMCGEIDFSDQWCAVR